MLIGHFRWIGLLAKVWCSHHREFCEKSTQLGPYFKLGNNVGGHVIVGNDTQLQGSGMSVTGGYS